MSTTLTDDEKELLSAALWHDQVPADLIEAVERIVAEREAQVLRDLGYWLEKNVASPAAHRHAYAVAEDRA